MKTLLLAFAAAAAAQGSGPTVAQFDAALAAACPDHPAATRNVSCAAEAGSIQYSCRYEMQGADGNWARHDAILQQAEGEWVWIDGPTRCDDQEAPELN